MGTTFPLQDENFSGCMLVMAIQQSELYQCVCVCVCVCVCARARTHAGMHSHVQLCDPVDCCPPVTSVHGILQAKILEWAAISSSRESSQPRSQIRVS